MNFDEKIHIYYYYHFAFVHHTFSIYYIDLL